MPLNQALENMMLDEYYILTKRIKGMGLSLKEYWDSDSYQIGYIFQKEKELMDYESKEYEDMKLEQSTTSRTGKKVPNKYEDDEELEDIYNSFTVG